MKGECASRRLTDVIRDVDTRANSERERERERERGAILQVKEAKVLLNGGQPNRPSGDRHLLDAVVGRHIAASENSSVDGIAPEGRQRGAALIENARGGGHRTREGVVHNSCRREALAHERVGARCKRHGTALVEEMRGRVDGEARRVKVE